MGTCSGSSPVRHSSSELIFHVTRIGKSWSISSCTETQSRRSKRVTLVKMKVLKQKKVKVKKRKRTVRKEKKVKHGPPVLLPSKISHERRHDLKEPNLALCS